MNKESLPDEMPIWRYLDLERFVIMLVSGSLRFTKAAAFGDDPWEGFCKVILPNPPEADADGTVRPNAWEELRISIASDSGEYLKNAREHLYVNSWSFRRDCMAMWKIYGSNSQGLAIQSSIGLYKAALDFNLPADHYAFGSIKYIDDIANSSIVIEDLTNQIPFQGPGLRERVTAKGFFKRSSYDYEEEWRGALYQDYRDIKGVDISCRLDTLIERVIVGPKAPEFIARVIEKLMNKFGLAKPVTRSELLSPPITRTAFN
jgi:hypothetical protein